MGTVVKKRKQQKEDVLPGLVNVVFSWSLADVLNKDLYKNEVKQIPDKFSSTHEYFKTFVNPLIEETHADVCSSMTSLSSSPMCQIYAVREGKGFQPPKSLLYGITVKTRAGSGKKESHYEPMSGDLVVLTDVLPKHMKNLNSPRTHNIIAFVRGRRDEHSGKVHIVSSKRIYFKTGDMLFAVYLTNLTTNMRIWNGLHPGEGRCKEIIKAVLCYDPSIKEDCALCLSSGIERDNLLKTVEGINALGLDDSQRGAVTNCIALTKCHHRNSVKLIWGPPGTGKTKTIASLLCALLRMSCRTLICAPTNVAVMGVVKRLMDNLHGALEHDVYGLGDLVLFGNGDRMKIDEHEDLFDVFLDHRISTLAHCLAPSTGWRTVLNEMIYLLEYPEYHYQQYQERQMLRNKDGDHLWLFDVFFKSIFTDKRKKLIHSMKILYTHLPTRLLPMEVLKCMITTLDKFELLQSLVDNITSPECLKNGLNGTGASILHVVRLDCLQLLKCILKTLSLPTFKSYYRIKEFCLENACLVFCTVSSSAKLQTKGMKPLELVIIDEAAQLKECESCIPLQLRGICHAILVGDERQLPAMVQSKICREVGFGRSLFERLVTIGHHKHLLNVQYRMHPQISLFPNVEFYEQQVTDGCNVLEKSYEKCFLKENMFGSYSFINIANGREELDKSKSWINVVEVHVLSEILSRLYNECTKSNKKVRVGCISPYKAQVFAIQKLLGKAYSTDANHLFSVNISSVDGFQGGEEDIIIISTVRSNGNSSIGFLSNCQRTNVALTRARYCLWILGNEATLLNSGSVWQKLVLDAKSRGCFYNAYEDKSLSLAIMNALNELGQLLSLFSSDSILFKSSKWKICFGDSKFHKSIARIRDVGIRKQVIALLVKLSDGWRQQHTPEIISQKEGASYPLLEWCDVNERRKLVWTVDILSENSTDTQVIKVLDVVPLSEIPAQAKKLGNMAQRYALRKLKRCMYKRVEGGLTLPMTWSDEQRRACPNEDLLKQLAALTL